MPEAAAGCRVATLNGKIYDIGKNFTYDPTTDAWASGTPIPDPQGPGAVTAFQGKIYSFGGLNGTDSNTGWQINSVATLVYDPATDAYL